MSLINIRKKTVSVEHAPIEIVERKGRGHPDTLCDGAAEELSVALSRYYLAHFGAILHHNTDKALLVGGRAHAAFGSGEVIAPMYLLLSGRATVTADEQLIPVGAIALKQVTAWMGRTLPHLRLPGDLIVDYRINPSSPDLHALFSTTHVPRANDSSFAVATAPLSELERLVKSVEEDLNGAAMKRRYPQIGEDIKVMGLRTEEQIQLTISVAFIAAETPNLATYLAVKEAIAGEVHALAATITRRQVTVMVNTGDRIETGNVYLTVTGTSAEQGDDGEVGRGNRVNGLITPMRPMTLEATAGKNPVAHVGKLYQVYAQQIVNHIVTDISEVDAATCTLLAQIGAPITEPQAIAIDVESPLSEEQLTAPITRIVNNVLNNWEAIRDGFLHRRWPLF